MKKELLKQMAITVGVGVGAGLCGALLANKKIKKAKKEVNEIVNKASDNEVENLEVRINRLERECANQDYKNTYFLVVGFIVMVYVTNCIDKNFRHVQEKHNGLVKGVADTFVTIGNVCEEFDSRISAMEVK
jgi:hypothetical protein